MVPLTGNATAETAVSCSQDTHRTLAPDGDEGQIKKRPVSMREDLSQGKCSVLEKLQQAATTNADMTEGNAQFLKSLQVVYASVKKLEVEVNNVPNTKKEIKDETASLTSAISNLIKWGRSTGRMKPLTNNKECQTDTVDVESEGHINVTVDSPDRSRFEDAGAIKYLKEEMRNRKVAMANLSSQIDKLLEQNQSRKEQLQPQRE